METCEIGIMKILFFGDLHCHNYSQFARILSNGRNSRFQNCLDAVKQASDICIERNVQYVMFLGDLFETWRLIDVDVMQHTYAAFKNLSESCEKLYILIGNHDQYEESGRIITAAPFDYATVVKTSWITQLEYEQETLNIAFQPYTSDPEEFRSFVRSLNNINLFLFHQPLQEAILPGSGLPLGKGMSVKDLPLREDILCIGSDIHKRQWLNSTVLYLGSPLQHDFGEAGDEKGFTLLDTETWEPQSEKSETLSGPDKFSKLISFIPSKAPKFWSFDSLNELEANIDKTKANDFFRVHCTKEEGGILQQRIKNIQIIPTSVEVDFKQRMKPNLSDDQMITEWVKRSRSSLDQQALIITGLEFLRPTGASNEDS